MEIRSVALPFEDISILQDVKSQAVSSDSEFLYQTIISHCSDRYNNSGPRVFELGSGNGIIAIMLALSRPDWQITALEVQISQYLLARHNVEQSGVKVTLLLADLRKSIHSGNNNRYDLIYANPPYFQIGTARISPSLPRAISRYELLCDMDNLLSVVNNNLTPEGEAYILYPDFRLPDLHRKAGRYGLEILKEIGKKNKSSKNREEIEDNERGSKSWTVSILGRR